MRKQILASVFVTSLSFASFAPAQDVQQLKDIGELLSTPQGLKLIADTLWVLIAAFLVFWMNAGFALVESGFCRAKNTANILAKNFIVFAITTLAFWSVGFAFMFGDGNSFIGWKGLALTGEHNAPIVALGKAKEYSGDYSALSWTSVPLFAAFLFQLVFAGTAATIVSGAVAERIKYSAFIVFSFVMGSLIYPIVGHWIWGGGWLAQRGMYDFAGSTVVHSVGGWAALTGAAMLGPRLGKYGKDGKINPIPGHSMALATLGVFILWLGWFGFNPGSTMAANPPAIARIAVTTNIAAASAGFIAALWAWLRLGKPDLSMMLNGGLAGLVAITAPCAFVSPVSAFIIGVVAGVLVVESVLFFDRVRIDDPVGAISVHLVNGIWGTLAVGLFAQPFADLGSAQPKPGLFIGGSGEQFIIQLTGVVAVGAFTFAASLIAWAFIKALVGLRVDPEEEVQGLDIGEMGMEAYPSDPFPTFEALSVTGWEKFVPTFAHQPATERVSAAAVSTTVVKQQATDGSPIEVAPMPAVERRLYSVVLENANTERAKRRWERLCHEPQQAPPEFHEVYRHLVSFDGREFVFRGGDPERMRKAVERLFEGYLGVGAKVTVEAE
ncbi:MAG: ammonium transporter [Armatimonadetes bacterium]|nr:ammonium transporter [Armatimonadota bacterium]MDW8028653.1 ammonium transporter [Armatimonadota bacterium]